LCTDCARKDLQRDGIIKPTGGLKIQERKSTREHGFPFEPGRKRRKADRGHPVLESVVGATRRLTKAQWIVEREPSCRISVEPRRTGLQQHCSDDADRKAPHHLFNKLLCVVSGVGE